jgi:hypothetical protein
MTCTVDVDENVQERVEVPEPVTPLGVALQEVLLVLRLTVPVKPFREVTVRLDVPLEPTFTLTLVGFAVIAKSWTLYVTVAE